jgi:hypothetical protein
MVRAKGLSKKGLYKENKAQGGVNIFSSWIFYFIHIE